MKKVEDVVMGIKMNESGIICLNELVCDINWDGMYLCKEGDNVIYVYRSEREWWVKELEEIKKEYCEDMEYEIVS